jgi:hypothetical protein
MDFVDGDFFELLCSDKLKYYPTHNILKKNIDDKYILTHNSDTCIEYIGDDKIKVSLCLTKWSEKAQSEFGDRVQIKNISDKNLFWFSQNVMSNGDKRLIALPIGLERKRWSNGTKHETIKSMMTTNVERDNLLYVNFNEKNHYSRKNLKLHFKQFKDCKIINNKINFNSYCNDLVRSKYTISPIGNGFDCHRTWEALYLGSIPIIEKNNYYNEIYHDMPVLLVDDYTKLTENFLLEKYKEIVNKSKEKLNPIYWKNKILNKIL